MAQIFSALYFGYFIFLFIFTGDSNGWKLGNSISFVIAFSTLALLFSSRLFAPDSKPEAFTDEDLYRWIAWGFSLLYIGFFGYLCGYGKRETQATPVPDRLTYHG